MMIKVEAKQNMVMVIDKDIQNLRKQKEMNSVLEKEIVELKEILQTKERFIENQKQER